MKNYLSILGRQPSLGLAELEVCFGESTQSFSSSTALFASPTPPDIQALGGSVKLGEVVLEIERGDWLDVSKKIVQYYADLWRHSDHKITLGISVYDLATSPRDIQKTALHLKQTLKKHAVSLRIVPNQGLALNSATSHHNKLGLSANKVELLIARNAGGTIVVAQSLGAQNITALAARDQARPKTDAFVGMLPPKLALMMLNLATGATGPRASRSTTVEPSAVASSQRSAQARDSDEAASLRGEDCLSVASSAAANEAGSDKSRSAEAVREDVAAGGDGNTLLSILDPFCGTGVVLQEAMLRDFDAVGSDLSEKMVTYSRANLKWLKEKYHLRTSFQVAQADAMTASWHPPIDAVVAETYLGQPFSAPPSPAKLAEVRRNCDHIISQFLKNIAPQLASGTPLCLAVPAWRDASGHFTHLSFISHLDSYGFTRRQLKAASDHQLLYYREGQVVARQLLLLTRS